MNRKSDTAVFTVIFPENIHFFNDYIESLKNQSYTDFDLVLMNDGVINLPDGLNDFNTLLFPGGNSIAKTRMLGIERLLELGHNKIIFADSDDMLSNNRLEVSVELLGKYDFVANDLDLINEKSEMIYKGFWKDRLEEEEEIPKEFLFDQNIFGLGNTAMSGRALSKQFLPEQLQVVDWYLFLNLIKEDHRATFTKRAQTQYRQYSRNIGAAGEVTPKSLLRAIDIKSTYYDLLSNNSVEFMERKNKMDQFKVRMKDEDYFEAYLEKAHRTIKNPFWWEEVKL